jgi:hypothetical protein
MGGIEDAGGESRQGLALMDSDGREGGWQQLDLETLLAPSPRTSRADLVLIEVPKRGLPRRVPGSAFVSIGSRRRGGIPVYPIRPLPRCFANDNAPDKRALWRDLVFLMILAATVAGAFWSGRMHGYQKVIVVPAPSSFHTIVT